MPFTSVIFYFYRDESYGARSNSAFMPYDGFLGPDINTIDVVRRYIVGKCRLYRAHHFGVR